MMNKKHPKPFSIILILLVFILSINNANAQGPNAPEAASFEPVDATDMVNLVTGDLSYVLPLLNVPSPEGGYPIALSYHAGIAMEQEASWVGLGWSLNPGTINRGVNGYPDDWGKTNVNEFFYDAGGEENYYSFSGGVTFGGGVSVGLGLSWGSNQSVGGYISASIGLGGESGASIGASIGTNGASVFGGIGGFNASVGTSGVGIGYGTGGNTSVGAGLNYSYNSGLSGGVSISKAGASLGINFSSSGVSLNGSAGGVGFGVNFSTNGVSTGDYHVDTAYAGFVIPAYIFYIGYSHKRITYSLYKYNNLYTSGILNPVVANELRPYTDSSSLSRLLYESNFMDVGVLPRYENFMDVDELLDNLNQVDKNNLVIPNYDNYSVTAQGLSGTLKPYIHSELNLSGRGRGDQNDDDLYMAYLNYSVTEYNTAISSGGPGVNANRDAIKKVHFTFDNAYNSFLRMERSNINEGYLQSLHSDHIMDAYETDETFTFNNSNSITTAYEARKREGNHIETFTNKQIRDSYSGSSVSNIYNFIDAKQYDNQNNEINLDRSDMDMFLDEGIGAYQITTPDGRTYHYSLPVYNFESFYKNFKNENNEDENFFEIQKTTPYATHWLLTAITGPDYVDINNNGTVDENDYGYWVAFDYGKWSDGYAWQTPNGYNKVDENDDGDKTYSYVWGRKQIYYLDVIKTRTHTALFVKNLREDNLSSTEPNTWKEKWTNGNFDLSTHTKNTYYKGDPTFAFPGDKVYTGTGELILPDEIDNVDIHDYVSIGKIGLKYIDIPKNKTLKLDKIILLKNKDLTNVTKKRGSVISSSKGVFFNNILYDLTYGKYYISGSSFLKAYYLYLYENQVNNPKEFDIHLHQNVLDVKDIEGLGLESLAQQVIEFNHDYSLAKNSPNSDDVNQGRLTLNEVNFKGKQGVQLVPPYKFSYLNQSTFYNKDNIDEWGYNVNNPLVWSLNEIQTPTGGEIKIEYEPDSYYAEAAYPDEPDIEESVKLIYDTANNPLGLCNLSEVEITLRKPDDSYFVYYPHIKYYDPSKYFEVGGRYRMIFSPSATNAVTREFQIVSINDHVLVIQFLNSGDPQLCLSYLQSYKEAITLTGRVEDYRTIDDPVQGRLGGGIRTKSIEVDGVGTTEYVYTDPETNSISGITSYAPSDEPKGVPYISELPPPMVIYEHVTMKNYDNNDAELGSTAYQFETLEPLKEETGYIFSLGEAFKVKENQNTTFQNGSVVANKYSIHSSLGNIGRLLSITSYNNKNQVLSQKRNNYKTGLDGDGEIGVTQESHKSYKRIFKDNVESFTVSSTSKVNYPSVLESTTSTQGGFTSTTNFIKYDFLTGQVLESTTTDSKGNEFKTELVPAYTILEYSGEQDLNNDSDPDGYGMGSKVDNDTNKNMLTQEAMTKTYLKVGTAWKETGVGITTWNNYWTYTNTDGSTSTPTNADEKIWRKHKSFVWDSDLDTDGTYLDFTGDDDSFNWTLQTSPTEVAQTNSDWKNVSTTTQYDHFSALLEVRDINDNYVATKMCDDNSKILAVSNARYTEMYYSGAEYVASNTSYFDGQVGVGQGDITSDYAHTGIYSVKATSDYDVFQTTLAAGEHRTGKYKISAWVYKSNYYQNARISINNSTHAFNGEEVIAGDWVLLNHYVDLLENTAYTISLGSDSYSLYYDDFRLYPIASSMTSYVYNEWDELWYIIGNNGLASKFEYDKAGRLIKSYTEVEDFNGGAGGFKLMTKNSYNYKSLGTN